MGKQYKNVKEMIKESSLGQRFKDRVLKEIEKSQISKFLIVLRCKHNLTQKQIAEKIGCTQSRISKIETSYDEDITIKDLIDYAKALNLKLEIGYRQPSVKIVDLIKYHALKISEYLNQLVELTKDKQDEALEEGIVDFLKEAYVNLNFLVLEKFSKINFEKNKRKLERTKIHISFPFETLKNETKENNQNVEQKTD